MKRLAVAIANLDRGEESLSLPALDVGCDERTTQCFQELRNPLCRYLLTLGLSREEVDEVAQETFLRLYQHLCANGNESSIRGWVFRVAHNLGTNERKR